MSNFTCSVKLEFNSPKSKVWAALTQPEIIKQYFFGTSLVTDWKVGSAIFWRGEWDGKAYEDKGTVLAFNPENSLKYDYFSSFSGLTETPENYQQITYQLNESNGITHLTIIQENCKTEETKAHSEQNWKSVMEGMRKFVE